MCCLTLYSPADDSPQAFRQGLRALGHIEGQNIAIEWRSAEGKYGQLPALAADLVRLKVDVIVANVTRATLAAKQVTATIPIVMMVAADPVGGGLVPNLARPGGNITGLSILLPDISAKRLQLLTEAVPRVSRVAVLWSPGTPVGLLGFEHTNAVSAGLEPRRRRALAWQSAAVAAAVGGALAAAGAIYFLAGPRGWRCSRRLHRRSCSSCWR